MYTVYNSSEAPKQCLLKNTPRTTYLATKYHGTYRRYRVPPCPTKAPGTILHHPGPTRKELYGPAAVAEQDNFIEQSMIDKLNLN